RMSAMLLLLLSPLGSSRVGEAVAEWLGAAAAGYCRAAPLAAPGSCSHGHAGSHPLRSSLARTWPLAARACVSLCLSCPRCTHVSISLIKKDCSWFHSCPPNSRLHARTSYRSARCEATPMSQVNLSRLPPHASLCSASAGDSRLTHLGVEEGGEGEWEGEREGEGKARARRCGRQWLGTREARCVWGGTDAVFLGNSVARRQMYTLLELLAGEKANRQHPTTLATIGPSRSREQTEGSWIWDVASKSDADAASSGFHAAQLITIDLSTGKHRFSLPHRLCGLGDVYSTFNLNRYRQWRSPPIELPSNWRDSKWARREWRPLLSFRLDSFSSPSSCEISPADSFLGGSGKGWENVSISHAFNSSSARLRRELLRAIARHFGRPAWLVNVSVHIENPLPSTHSESMRRNSPNVWILFPTYHGERETFNGFCEDKPCACSGRLASCSHHPQCARKHECYPLSPGSASFVDHAISFGAALRVHPRIAGRRARSVRLTPFYDDCWEHRGRCGGMRPCPEPIDHPTSCRATAMMCRYEPWPEVLAREKAWVPKEHVSASLLYLYDGHWTAELFDETFRSWSPHSVGYGADLLIFGCACEGEPASSCQPILHVCFLIHAILLICPCLVHLPLLSFPLVQAAVRPFQQGG
ncbi:MAG: hypothetical protein SGPRY_015026, partial [Prymnesium sp.]